jgi:hypothetical protein
LALVMILDKLMLEGEAAPFIMSMISLESPTFLTSRISNSDIGFRPLHKMCVSAIFFVVWPHPHANFSLIFLLGP